MGRTWIKLSTGIFDDEKIRLIEMMPEGDSILVIWLKLLCLAGKTDNDGMFWLTPTIPYNAETLATVFNRKLTTVKLALDIFQKFGMLEVIDGCLGLPNWTKYQSETDAIERAKEKHRIRQKNWREREKKKNALLEATSSKRDVTVTVRDGHVTPTEIEEEKEIEKEINKEKAVAVKTPLSLIREFSGTNKDLLEALRAWLEMRKKMKRPLTGRATRQALKKLNELSAGDQDTMVQIVDQASMKGWLTFYPLKEKGALGGVLAHMNEIIPDTPEDDAATTEWLKEEGILDD